MTKLKGAELGIRLTAWGGAWLLEIYTVREVIPKHNIATFPSILLWIVVAATFVTGFFDMWRFPRRN